MARYPSLAEAIILGSTLGPQGFGLYFGPGDASCAVGSALKAVGIAEENVSPVDFWPGLLRPASCPGTFSPLCSTVCEVGPLVFHLNDCHRWSRAQIAEYLQKAGLDCQGAEREPMHAPVIEAQLCY